MGKTITTLAAGMIIAVAAMTSSQASTPVGEAAGLDTPAPLVWSDWPELAARMEEPQLAVDLVEVAVNRLIRIGPRGNRFTTWRCAVSVNGDRYYAVGVTETGTRARLATVADKHFHCRRERRGLFF